MTDNQPDDESLGVAQLPQDELEASPGDGNIDAANFDVNAAESALTPAVENEQHGSKSQPSPTTELDN